jgi:hypothetical protein
MGQTQDPKTGRTVSVPPPQPLNLKTLLDAAAHRLSKWANATGSRIRPQFSETLVEALGMKLAMGATRGAEWTRAELSGWITESVASAQREIENRFISVPRRNGFFTGREEVLARLHAELTSGGRAAITQAISGLGGIGKTAMAIEYAHRHKDDYACVLWTNAASEGALWMRRERRRGSWLRSLDICRWRWSRRRRT